MISIFDKAIGSITQEEKNEIHNRWVNLDTSFDYGQMLRIILFASVFFIIVLGVSAFWIVRLRREIRTRKRIGRSLIKAKQTADRMNKELQLANEELEALSLQDGLTGIFNRRYFDRSLEIIWNEENGESDPLSIVMMDIDFFKKYNDTYGHVAGDVCLQKVAGIMSEAVQRKNSFLARYGGEEFVFVLPQTSEQEAKQIAESIRGAIESAEIYNGLSYVPVTISLGVATAENVHASKSTDLIERADEALYEAKRTGRNRVVAYSSLEKS